jgi:ABC-2 type transport system ATP-binding protein
MSDKKPILECRSVSIRYRAGDFKNIGLKEWVMRRLTGNYRVVDFWADRDINFSIDRGDMLGIVGTNGAGKSTLLKAVSGIMEPTCGRIVRAGRVSALLELASGFDGDLTVKENAYLRGAMLGYTRKFMDETYPYIIEFAELKNFEERPFKQLSSGMKSRLAFAIASLVKPEILILDEVLSVGDGAFRLKSEAKMREVIGGGATTILVSHSVGQVRALCNKVLWLDRGRQIAFTDDVEGVCDCYEEYLRNRGEGPVYDPVAAKARIDARRAAAVRKAEEARRMADDAARMRKVREVLRRHLKASVSLSNTKNQQGEKT